MVERWQTTSRVYHVRCIVIYQTTLHSLTQSYEYKQLAFSADINLASQLWQTSSKAVVVGVVGVAVAAAV